MNKRIFNKQAAALSGAGALLCLVFSSGIQAGERHGYGAYQPYQPHVTTASHVRNRQGFRGDVRELIHSASRFRESVERRIHRHGHGYGSKRLHRAASRLESLSHELLDTRRRDRNRRAEILYRLGKVSARIDEQLYNTRAGKRIHKRWKRTRQHLGKLNRYVGYKPRHNGPKPAFGFNDGRFSGRDDRYGYHHPGFNTTSPGHRPGAKKNGAKRPWKSTVVRGAVDLIEDESERTKNAFRAHTSRNGNVRKAPWARSLDGQLSAFDQVANRLRDCVRRGDIASGRNLANEVRSRAAGINRVMMNEAVGHSARQHWVRVMAAIRTMTNATA